MQRRFTYLLSILLFTSFFFAFSSARAATAGPRVYIERVGAFGAQILIDSETPVNAYAVSIRYNPAIVEVDRVKTSESLITITPRPFEFGNGSIVLRGGSTSPFSGERGILAELSLRPVGEGVVIFDIVDATAYTADGTGNPIALSHEELPLRVTADSFGSYGEASRQLAITTADILPPVLIDIRVAENPLSAGSRLIVFAASDDDSGVSRYEARDKVWLSWSPWRAAVNPYPVDDGAWSVQLKAIDNEGNATLATIYNAGPAFYKGLGLIVLAWLILRGGQLLLRRRLLKL